MKVAGPITEGTRANAFGSPIVDLDGCGYLEEEFFFEGQARAYAPARGTRLGVDGRWKLQPSRTAPFKTRMLVVRPTDTRKFSGNVWLSWLNVSSGFEIVDAPAGNLRDGDALVYVSAQKVGLDGFVGAEANGLRGWDPERYGSLHHPGDDFSYDIFTQAVRLVGPGRVEVPVDPMGGLDVVRVFATGASQSAMRLTSYLDGVQPIEQALDGALLLVSFGRAARLETPPSDEGSLQASFLHEVRIRDDLGIPVLHVSTETEAEGLYPVRQPDTDTFRTWEIAGAAHASATGGIPSEVVQVFIRDALQLPQWGEEPSGDSGPQPNSLRWLPVSYAARHHLAGWAAGAKRPPSLPLIEFAGDPPCIRRDEHGNAVGGMRMPELEVPFATYRGTIDGAGEMGSMFGSMKPFAPEQLRALYPSRDAYLAAYDTAVDRAVESGYILETDADDAKAHAMTQADELFSGGERVEDEGVIDPWVSEWFAANPERAVPFDNLSPEMLELARGPVGAPPTREIADVTDDLVDGVSVRIYRGEGPPPTGILVYFHGGGFIIGSIGLMDNVARELAHSTGAVVVSVGYRLAPEHPYPAGLDDCETVTRWASANAERFDVSPSAVAVCGESAGGNLAAAVALRLRDAGDVGLAAQILIYPAVAGRSMYPSKEQFDGLVVSRTAGERYWAAYTGGRDLDEDPCAVPLRAPDLKGLPPALVVLGGCDVLRDEGRAYAARLGEDGVEVEEVCYPGQPHGFVNFGFPAAGLAFDRIGAWLRSTLSREKR